MKFKCPFYYKLEENFLPCAGIRPSIASDELFHNQEDGFDVEGLGEEDELAEYDANSLARKRHKKSNNRGRDLSRRLRIPGW